jgi:dephospho-CoA kinase
MRVVGLTGGIATGKSTFSAALRAAGAPVIDADLLARQVVEPGRPELEAVVAAFGEEVRAPDGGLDRRKLGARVFSDPAARQRLEAILHPAVRRAMLAESARLSAQGHGLAVYDVPLLFEVGLDQELDCTVLVYAPPAAALARILARDQLSRAEAEARVATQLPIDAKAARADVVVLNEGTVEQLQAKAGPLLVDLRAGLSRKLPNAPPKRY